MRNIFLLIEKYLHLKNILQIYIHTVLYQTKKIVNKIKPQA